jgi:hypothetical protein
MEEEHGSFRNQRREHALSRFVPFRGTSRTVHVDKAGDFHKPDNGGFGSQK